MELTETYTGNYAPEDARRREADGTDAASFADLYVRSRDDIYRAVLVTVRDPHRAEDAVQEAFAARVCRLGPGQRSPEPRWVGGSSRAQSRDVAVASPSARER